MARMAIGVWILVVAVSGIAGAGGSSLPPVGGTYAVGVRSFAWVDNARAETATADENDQREVAVQIWYPAKDTRSNAVAPYFPELEQIFAAAEGLPEQDRNFVLAHTALRDVATNSFPSAPLARSPKPWPVILFSPGGNVSRHAQTSLAERLAAAGFVFVSMTHPYSTIDVTPHGGFSMSIDWGINQEDAKAARVADDRLADVLAGDATFVLQQLRKLADEDHGFASRLALDRVGIAGHSRGGTTVGRACSVDPSFVACAVLDNIGPDREAETGVRPPFLTLRSPWGEDRVAALHAYLGRTRSVAHDVELANSNHFTCTDLPLFLNDVRVEGVEPADGIATCAAIVGSFFDAYLNATFPNDGEWHVPFASKKTTVTRFMSQLEK